MNMNGAEGSALGVIGAIVLEFTCTEASGARHSTRQLCYVCEKINKVFLSIQGCIALGMVDSNFPTPKNLEAHEAGF